MQTALIKVMPATHGEYEARLALNWDGLTTPGDDAPCVNIRLADVPAAPEGFQDWASFLLQTAGASPHFGTLGRALHDLVCTGAIREALDRIDEPLRLLLRVEPEELDILPWEFMRDGDLPLFTDESRPIARAAASFNPALELSSIRWPLRVMLVVGSKDELVQVREEIDYVTDGFRRVCGLVDLEVAWLPSRGDIRDMCKMIQPHVFHFVGHGGVDQELGGYLRLEQAEGPADQWTAAHIRSDLSRCAVRLAVLNACQSGQHSEREGTLAAAQGLAELKVPAVIAMQGPIRGTAAARFAKGLYEALSTGVPLDQAVVRGRVEITDVAQENRRDYAMPALTLRAPPERILDLAHDDPRTTFNGQPELATMLSFVDRIPNRRQLWERLQPDIGTGPRVFTITGPARTGKGALVRWCLGVALMLGHPVALADFTRGEYVDSVRFLDTLVDAVSASGVGEIGPELAKFRAERAAYQGRRSFAESRNSEFTESPVNLYKSLCSVLAALERTLVIGIDGLVKLEMGAWLNQVVPAFVGPIASGQPSNVRLIVALPDNERAMRFPPQDFAGRQIEDIPLQFFPSADFVALASQRMRARNYTRASFSGLVNDYLHEEVKRQGYWDTQPFDFLDIAASIGRWATE
jgi:hypothetical protein